MTHSNGETYTAHSMCICNVCVSDIRIECGGVVLCSLTWRKQVLRNEGIFTHEGKQKRKFKNEAKSCLCIVESNLYEPNPS